MSYVSLIFSYFSISVIPSIVRPALVCPAQCWMTTAGYIQPFISDLSTRAVLAAWWTLSWSLRGRAGTGNRGTSSTTTTSSPPPLRTPHFTSGSLSSSSSRYGSNSIYHKVSDNFHFPGCFILRTKENMENLRGRSYGFIW